MREAPVVLQCFGQPTAVFAVDVGTAHLHILQASRGAQSLIFDCCVDSSSTHNNIRGLMHKPCTDPHQLQAKIRWLFSSDQNLGVCCLNQTLDQKVGPSTLD